MLEQFLVCIPDRSRFGSQRCVHFLLTLIFLHTFFLLYLRLEACTNRGRKFLVNDPESRLFLPAASLKFSPLGLEILNFWRQLRTFNNSPSVRSNQQSLYAELARVLSADPNFYIKTAKLILFDSFIGFQAHSIIIL